MQNEYQKQVARIAERVLSEARRLATPLGASIAAPDSKVLADVLDAVQDQRPVAVQLEGDKRAQYWRARLRLFGPSGELEADSDPELPLEAPGATVVRSLPGVLEWAGDLLAAFHAPRGERVTWIDNATAQKRIKSIRPTLSRNNGKATWRLPYRVDSHEWRALIEIERETV